MRRSRTPSLSRVTAADLNTAVARYPDDRRSDLFVWMATNREQFARELLKRAHTWAAFAQAFDDLGIRSNSTETLRGGTVRNTWYQVRQLYGMEIGPAPERAEKAKVAARRKPRSPRSTVTHPPPRPGEVALGVRLVQPADPVIPSKLALEKQSEPGGALAALHEQMRRWNDGETGSS
jgi:hypothetical protein